MDETATRRTKIDPKLYEVGWEQVPDSVILTEQRAYQIAPGRVERIKRQNPKKADYVLEYRGQKLAVIEAKSDERHVSEGVEQAKRYAEMLNIRYTYATNGDEIWAIDMGVKNDNGEYVIPSKEGPAERFPTPQELWKMTFPDSNEWRDNFNLCAFNRDGNRTPRYYQEIAINKVLAAVANEQRRILLTMATGTGKTYTAFQICWKLFQTGWNKNLTPNRKPRILFISDRNILANQAKNDFGNFNEDSMVRVTPEELAKNHGRVPTSRHIYFTIFQTFMSNDDSGNPYFMQYPQDFFDFIIIDECHRGGANDESEWRRLMEYFSDAYQLGMTATPRRRENANTYQYFGNPVYSYSLKQGIADGYLTPFRVWISESNIDDYKYNPDDDVEGDIDKEKTYTESDFYNGNIVMRDRDEYRVKEMLGKIEPDEKTIVFCATQQHAAIIRDMINQHKSRPDANYCVRVTSDDGKEGEDMLKQFQNNDRLRPTILTTSQKLSTGVDARNVRNIVLLRPVNSMVEFKQIIGRGTRLFDNKYYFTIYDFVGAAKNFEDAEWDGDPFCPVCGNYPCTCNKKPKQLCPKCGQSPCVCTKEPPEPCPVCGHLPCTCQGQGGKKKDTIVVKLSEERKVELFTKWEEKVQFGDELIGVDELVVRLFGAIPRFFDGAEDLRKKWEHPDTRKEVLERLEQEGFGEDKLLMIQRVMQKEKCDLLDVLEYLAYSEQPIERAERVRRVKEKYFNDLAEEQSSFFTLILDFYVRNGFKELAMEKLKKYIDYKYNSMQDAKRLLNMTNQDLRTQYIALQSALYCKPDETTARRRRQGRRYTLTEMMEEMEQDNMKT
ncbi:MAG: DEAD/DEAH box helicase family protein [Prevotella sp.]|nr:DEAD/DEAH box helicase family protein [Prevotella sp.]